MIDRDGVTTSTCFDAYAVARGDSANDFVGLLRKPVWWKRGAPKSAVESARMAEKARERQAERTIEGARATLERAGL